MPFEKRSRAWPPCPFVPVAIILALILINTCQSVQILVGNNGGFSSRIAKEARDMRIGLETAFAEANATNTLRGVYLSLVSVDDGYDIANISRVVNELINVQNVTLIMGSMGTAVTTELVQQLNSRGLMNVPVFGPWTGSDQLRNASGRNVVHLRAGFFDETAAVVDWLTSGTNYFTRISAFHQTDGFGSSGVRGIVNALDEIGLAVYSSGSYQRGSFNFAPAINNILNQTIIGKPETAPEVICVFALPEEALKFIWDYRNDPRSRNDTIFVLLSIVSPDVFFQAAESHSEWATPIERIYTTHIVPNPQDTSFKLVQSFQNAMRTYFPAANYSHNALEGYLNGRFLIEVLSRVRGEFTAAKIIDAVYQGKYLTVDDVLLGPYGDSEEFRCSQGLRNVFFSQLLPSKKTKEVVSARFTWPREQCVSSSANLLRPIFFGQSAALTGPSQQLGIPYRVGLVAAFERFNRLGGVDGRPVRLLSLDDAYEPALSAENTKSLLKYQPMGLIGWSGTAVAQAAIAQSIPAKVPFFCPFTGALDGLRTPCSKYVIHTRVSYFDEAAAHVAWLYDNLGLRRISVFYQDDGFGLAGFNGVRRALQFRGTDVYTSGTHPRNSLAIEEGYNRVMTPPTSSSLAPQAVVLFVIYDPAAEYLLRAFQDARARSLVYIAPSVVNTDELLRALAIRQLSSFTTNLYVTQVFPSPLDTNFDIVREYRDALQESSFPDAEPSFLGLEGYMAGRLATRALQLVSGPLTPESLTNAIYEHPLFFFGGLRLGPYSLNSTASSLRDPNRNANTTQCLCNQGGHEIYLTRISGNATGGLSVSTVDSFDFTFDTCGLQFPVYTVDAISLSVKRGIQSISVLSALFCGLCGFGVIFFRETKTMRSSSPLFLSIILFGALLLCLSPLMVAEYYSDSLPLVRDATRPDPWLFVVWYWFIGLGFQLMFATVAVKTYRVDKIFNSLQFIEKVIIVKEKDLLIFLSIPVLLELVLLTLWTSVSYPTCRRGLSPTNPLVLVDICAGANDLPFLIVQAILFAFVAGVGCYFAFRTRNIRYGSFNESKEILFVVYNLVVVCIVLIPTNVGFSYNPLISALLRSVGVIFLVLVSIGTLFGGKFFRILIKKEGMSSDSHPQQLPYGRSAQLSLGPIASMFQSGFDTSSTQQEYSARPSTQQEYSARPSAPTTDESDTEVSSWEPPPMKKKNFWEQDPVVISKDTSTSGVGDSYHQQQQPPEDASSSDRSSSQQRASTKKTPVTSSSSSDDDKSL